MSGTSLDGVDSVVAQFRGQKCHVLHSHFLAYPDDLRTSLLALQDISNNELERSALLGNKLSELYAESIHQLLDEANIGSQEIVAIGCHGQTIRHRPELGFTLQIGNPALLAELTGITVVADFRSRDIAAGGQGAPLVPAFHQAIFGSSEVGRAIVNIGGIANITYLPTKGPVIGFDTGPGNMLMDGWIKLKLGKNFDANGAWAASGVVLDSLLADMLSEPYFALPPPKSTGRDLFNDVWLEKHLLYLHPRPQDIARTLVELTAHTIASGLKSYCADAKEVYLCGGGAHNSLLKATLQTMLDHAKVKLTDELGLGADWVEAACFAWLARQALKKLPASLPDVTGARGPRILGAIYQK